MKHYILDIENVIQSICRVFYDHPGMDDQEYSNLLDYISDFIVHMTYGIVNIDGYHYSTKAMEYSVITDALYEVMGEDTYLEFESMVYMLMYQTLNYHTPLLFQGEEIREIEVIHEGNPPYHRLRISCLSHMDNSL